MATTINLNLQSQVQETNRHVVQHSRSLLTTFNKLPWKASKLKHPSECYQYSTRKSILPLTVPHHQPHSQSMAGVIVATDKMSLISQPAPLQPRPPIRKHTAIVPRHKCVSFTEPFLYPDPLGDDRTDLSEFYCRISELNQLEEETVKWEEFQNRGNCRPSYSSTRLARRPSSEKQPLTVRPSVKTDETSQSIPALVVTQSPSKLKSPTHHFSSPDIRTEDHPVDNEVSATVSSPTHSESNDTQPIASAPVILTNGKLSSSDCQQARHHLRRSASQDHVSPRKNTKSHRKLTRRCGSAILLTASSSSTSVSSTSSERHHKHARANSTKKKHKK